MTVRYPGGITITDRPDARGYWRLRGPGVDRRSRNLAILQAVAWDHARDLHHRSEDPDDSEEPTVADLIEMYLAGAGRTRPLSPHTVRTMRSNLRRHALPVLGHLPCRQWDHQATRQVIAACEEHGLADSSIGKVVRDLSAVSKLGRELGHLAEDQTPCKGLTGPGPQSLTGTLPAADDILNFADHLVQVTGQEWRRLQVDLLAYAGLRAAELLGLQREDVDSGVLHVYRQLVGAELRPPKHGKQRDTVYPAWLDEDLNQWAEQQPAGAPLFPGNDGGYEPYGTFLRQRWQPAAHAAGWPKLPSGRFRWTAHTLRHHAATWMLSPDGLQLDVGSVAMFLGHSSPATTHRLYIQSRPDRFRRAREASRTAGR